MLFTSRAVDIQLEELLVRIDRRTGSDTVHIEASKKDLYRCFLSYFRSEVVAQALTVKVLNLLLGGGTTPWGSFGPFAMRASVPAGTSPRWIRKAKSYLNQTVLATGLTHEEFDAESYVASGLDLMFVTIGGATQGVYELSHKEGRIDVVYRNINRLVEAKRRLCKRTPVIRWQYPVFLHNVHEIAEAVEIARCLGLDEFRARWDDAEIEPVTMRLNKNVVQDLASNWNPFPGELDSAAIQSAFNGSGSVCGAEGVDLYLRAVGRELFNFNSRRILLARSLKIQSQVGEGRS